VHDGADREPHSFGMPAFNRDALKWHFFGLTLQDRAEDKLLDKVWAALRLDEISSKSTTDPDSLDMSKVPYELTPDERDAVEPRPNPDAQLLGQGGATITANTDASIGSDGTREDRQVPASRDHVAYGAVGRPVRR
jgi:hypothetical protein